MLKKRTSKEIFIETFLELSRRIPVDKITVRKLAEEAGLSSKTFYNHFHNMHDLMLYIERSETERAYRMLENENFSFHDFLVRGVAFYKKVQFFIINAFVNTSGQESFERAHAEHAYNAILGLLLRRNGIKELDSEMAAVLRLYVYGLVEMFYRFSIDEIAMSEEDFVLFCEENMPQKLRPYLIPCPCGKEE